MSRPWNHSIHYHPEILRALPANCRRVLDVGCGEGFLLTELARICPDVTGIDPDPASCARAAHPGVNVIEGDVMTHQFPEASFDAVIAVAVVHHLPLVPTLERLRSLVKPGGVLIILGLYRTSTLTDWLLTAVALPVSRLMRITHGYTEITAPIHAPAESFEEIREAVTAVLPGTTLERKLLWRYLAHWTCPNRTAPAVHEAC